MSATRVDLVRDGARATKADLGRLEIQLLSFAPAHFIPEFDVERPYAVVVLDGSVAKGFGRFGWSLNRGSLATLPAGAVHTSAFGAGGCRLVAIRTVDAERAYGDLLRRLRHVRAAASTAIATRLAAELRANDPGWALAAEGLALQLLATASRAEPPSRRGAWLVEARELLHERVPGCITLSALADAVGVHPSHLARAFRREYGTGVGEYARTLRIEWALARLGAGNRTLAEVAADAGFADQSHFTRAVRAYAGVTPARYRELVRR